MQSYQHIGRYLEGDLVWYQYQNNNAWLAPAAVLCHRGQSVWIHTNGDVKKVASCRVKPSKLIYRKLGNDDSKENDDNQVMLEDGLRDVKELRNSIKKTLKMMEQMTILKMKRRILLELNI